MKIQASSAACVLLIAVSSSALAEEASSKEWGADLPWTDLSSKLSTDASLIDTSFKDYTEQCIPEFVDYTYLGGRSNHALIDQPSGLCLPHMWCGWSKCNPRPSDDRHATTPFETIFQDLSTVTIADSSGEEFPSSDLDPSNPDGFILDATNQSLDLPTKVLFPVVASDIINAINFAKEHSLEISVKNSGHSYQGASSKKDTLLLNMNKFTQYSPTGITDCDSSNILDSDIAGDLSNQACHLSIAKDKPAVIRVGGGENFDKLYRAVSNANKAQEGGYRYHVVGGGAGTVSPMGWTWLGGLGGTTGSRRYGLGVDQVVQIEMVVPNGYHVKFGPTEWEDASADGFIVPKTKVVSGVCRSNPEEQDEEKWTWETCPEDFDIDFNDLWFAMRGGGGGTWGVVTSVLLQLHDYLPYHRYSWNTETTEECSALDSIYNEFRAMYFMLPSMLNVTKEMSNACGNSNGRLRTSCYGEDDIMSAWSRLLDERNISDGTECISKAAWNDFGEEVIMTNPMERFPGKAADSPHPSFPTGGVAFTLMPQSWIEENWDTFKEKYLTGDEYYSFGGAATTASDQANALSQAHRDAAATIRILRDENFWTNLFPQMFSSSDKTNFPPVANSNHAAGVTDFGPLKEDWTKQCPEDYTLEMRDAKCISFQELIYGTERLKRLEEIKLAVDPDFMFDCEYCILNNRPKSATVQEEDNEGGEGGGAVFLDDGENNSVSLGVSSSFALSVLLLATVLQ